jgi:oxygen-dependent protoporphyrinogen oxidase
MKSASSSTSTGTLVIGGGITGLAAAQRIASARAPFLLLESERRLGGKIATERLDGFVIEGGPDCFLAAKPGGIALARTLGIESQLRGTDPTHRRTFVKRGGRLHELPEGITGLVPSRLRPLLSTGILSWHGRLRAGLELFVPRRSAPGEETIAGFVARRFGREAYDWLVEPLLSGIYAGDGSRLSLAATFPQLLELERTHGSILRSMLRQRRSAVPSGGGPTGFVTPASGLVELVAQVGRRLPPDAVRCGQVVTAVERRRTRYKVRTADGATITADRVILAVPAHAAARLVEQLDANLSQELAGIPFVSTATVSFAYPVADVPRPLDGYGYVSPRAEGGPIVACTWTSNKFPDRVPPGYVLVRLFLGRAGSEAIVDGPEQALHELARAEMARLFGVTAMPTLARAFRWPRSIPQYVVGHGARLGRVADCVGRHPGLMLAGASYHGVGIPDCIVSGWAAADAALGSVGAAA